MCVFGNSRHLGRRERYAEEAHQEPMAARCSYCGGQTLRVTASGRRPGCTSPPPTLPSVITTEPGNVVTMRWLHQVCQRYGNLQGRQLRRPESLSLETANTTVPAGVFRTLGRTLPLPNRSTLMSPKPVGGDNVSQRGSGLALRSLAGAAVPISARRLRGDELAWLSDLRAADGRDPT